MRWRWKQWRRRLSVGAPRMIIRSHLPWPLRWALVALAFGFSAALAAWAFEFGRGLAGLDRSSKAELVTLREEVARLRAENERALQVGNTAESLLRTERVAQEKLAQTVRQLEGENLQLKNDLGFFETLVPASGGSDIMVRGLRADPVGDGQVQFQALLMQGGGRDIGTFAGRWEVTLIGRAADGKPWASTGTELQRGDLKFTRSARVGGAIRHPAGVKLTALQLRVVDARGTQRAAQQARLVD